METTEWITLRTGSWEHEGGGEVTLKIETRIFEQDGELYVEPLYYKVLDKQDRIIMDNCHAGRHGDRMWRYVEILVEDEYSASIAGGGNVLDWFAREHPAFEALRRERQIEQAMDRDWYISRVL